MKHYVLPMNGICKEEAVIQGNQYRITVLTERLVRLEYNENGMFEDYPTELIWYRNLPKPEFTISETDSDLKIITKYFELFYKKEKKHYCFFSMNPH